MTEKYHKNHQMKIMLGLLIVGFVGMFSETALNVAVAQIMSDFQIDTGTFQLLFTGYLLMIGITLPLSGLLTKLFTTRTLTFSAMFLFIIGALISALAPTFGLLLTGRLIQGIAVGISLPLNFVVLLAIYPPEKRGAAMGLVGLVIMFAPAVGPTLSGILVATLGWRFIFWVFIPVLLIAFFIALKFLENVSEVTKPQIDFMSIILSILGFGGLVFGASFASEQGWGAPIVMICLLVGLIAVIAFCKRQLKLDSPILNIHTFTTSAFAIGTFLIVITFAIILSSMYLIPMLWQQGLGLAAEQTGLIMLPAGLVNAALSILAGRLFDKHGAHLLVRIGFVITAIGAVMLVLTPPTPSLFYVLAAHIIMMIGIPLIVSPAQMYALNSLHGPIAADGSAIMNTLQQIGAALATAIATSFLVFGAHGKTVSELSKNDFILTSHLGFAFILGLTLIGLIVSFNVVHDHKVKEIVIEIDDDKHIEETIEVDYFD
ncbi:MFS transporter [Lactococcus hodotermopsidis]|uniref:MFS transporter n=1 Tax=Pseudolactococcus hodotermopsidis TaxID=2709157 RepID=A0A6A0BC56_9LACT|nr:DHA2 family efflux MFS transporter permease subunit [Lactococcus hodotermopsidis]GFH42436.1 MFS transporter [Lactococcus hodotermopsidis]